MLSFDFGDDHLIEVFQPFHAEPSGELILGQASLLPDLTDQRACSIAKSSGLGWSLQPLTIQQLSFNLFPQGEILCFGAGVEFWRNSPRLQ